MSPLWAAVALVQAQESASPGTRSPSAVEEIVITRPQGGTASVQDVSVSVSAFSADTLERKALGNVSEVGDLAPNVDIDKTSPFSGSSSVLSPFVRGIGQNDFAFNLEPGVGVYVDGVYFARTIGAVVDLLDLERVEILKGPQGTVFGRNTIGGALNVTTRRPSEEFNYKGDITVGRFDRFDVRGAVDIPLQPERLLSQLSFSLKRRDGYQERGPFLPGGQRVNSDEALFSRARYKSLDQSGGETQDNYRGKLVWLASDALELTLSGDFSRVDEQGIPVSLVGTNGGTQRGGTMPTLVNLFNTCISTSPDMLAQWMLSAACGPRGLAPTRSNPTAGTNPLPGLAGVNVDADPTNDRLPFDNRFLTDKDESFATGSNFSSIDAGGASLTADWELSDTLTVKSISAYRRLSAKFGTDLDGSPINIGDTSFSTNQKQYSQELQLIGSSFDGKLDWVGGLYYFYEIGDLTDFVPFAEGLVQVDGENLFKNIATAAFTNLTYSVTDAFALSAGVRFSDEHKDFEGRQRDLNSLPSKTGVPPSGFPDPSDLTRIFPLGTQRVEFDDFTVRLAAEYSLTEDLFTYASYSQGTKSGGFTTRLLAPEAPDPNRAPDFDQEEADSYEVGIKTQFLDRKLQANLAAFYTQYDNIQVTVQRGISPTFENAGEGVIRGVELEFQSLITDRLRLDGGIGILDAEYSDLAAGTLLDRSDQFVNTPDFSANVSGSYAIPVNLQGPVSLDGELTLQADYTHKSNIANDAENNPLFFVDHINVVNASIRYEPTRTSRFGNWDITLGLRNLTDTRYIGSGFENTGVGISVANFSRPREWYLTVRFSR